MPPKARELVAETAPRPPSGLPVQKADGRGSLGAIIRELRKEKGLSQEELARKACVDRTTIARVECGIFQSLSMSKLEGIAGALGAELKTLLSKAEGKGETFSHRGDLSRIEFSLDYPQEGFRLLSHIPKRREFFFGRIEIQPQKTVPTGRLPHPEQIYLHLLEGKILLTRERHQFLLKPGDCFTFSGGGEYEFYNPDQFKPTSCLFVTYPSFLPA